MELLFEVIFEFFLEGCFDIIKNTKIKRIYRKIILIFITLFYMSFIGMFIVLTFNIKSVFIKIIFTAIIVLIICLLVKLWVGIYKEKPFSL